MSNIIYRPRNRLGDITLSYADILVRAVETQGHDGDAFLESFRLQRHMLGIADLRISIPHFMRIGHGAGTWTEDPAIGLLAGDLARPEDHGLAGLAALTAETPIEALATLIRFEPLSSSNSRGRSRFFRERGEWIAHFYSLTPYNEFNYFVVDSVLLGWVRFIQFASAGQEVVRLVQIEYAERGLQSRFEQAFGCPVQFGAPRNALILNPSLDQADNPHASQALHGKLVQYCEQELDRLNSHFTLADRVREALAPLLRGQPPSLASVARQLGTTAWTLRRRLGEQNVTYRELLDQVRHELATDYVKETQLSFAEIAFLLGFASPAAFHKAFRRWEAEPAGAYRERMRTR